MTVKPIVAGTDGSEESLLAVDWAAREATLRGVPLRIVSAGAIRAERDVALAAAAAHAAMAAPGLPVETQPLEGGPAEAVTRSGSGASMLVLGSRGAGAFAAMVLGSVSRYAASHASCPVVVVRDESGSARGLIGVGLGDLENCADALTFAFEEASLRHAGLVAVHAWQAPQADLSRAEQSFTTLLTHLSGEYAAQVLRKLLASWREKYPDVPVSQDIVPGHPARALAGLSARVDLVVVGRHPGLPEPGSVRHAVLNHAHGIVVTVPSIPSA